jgi:hypothetical protein
VDFSQLTTWKDLALAAAPLITLVGVFYTGKIHLRGQAQARQIEHRKQQLQQFYGPALLQTERLLATRLMIITLRSEAEGDLEAYRKRLDTRTPCFAAANCEQWLASKRVDTESFSQLASLS